MTQIQIAASHFDLDVWQYRVETPGQRESVGIVDWRIEVGVGERLTDSVWSSVLFSFKTFIAAALESAGGRPPLSVGSLPGMIGGLRELARFMKARGLSRLDQITCAASWDYVDFLEDNYEDDQSYDVGADRKWGHSAAYRILNVVWQIYEYGAEMSAACAIAIAEKPFDGRTAYDVVTTDLGFPREGGLTPIPDEVAVPVLEAAHAWVTLYAGDILRLQEKMLGALAIAGEPGGRDYEAANEIIERFQFTTFDPSPEAWRGPIRPSNRTMLDGREVNLSTIQAARRLLTDLVAACCITIQGGTGLRAHELISLQSGTDADRGLPSCVSTTVTRDRMFEMFWVNGVSAKRDRTDCKWLLGARPRGQSYLPAPVQAIVVLQKLLVPWRTLGARQSLLVTFSASRGLPREPESIGGYTACSLTVIQKEFAIKALKQRGAMSNSRAEGEARKVRAHRWRTTFANFLFRANPKILIPLRDHYKHLSELYTDAGYIGTNVKYLHDLEGAREQATAQLLLGLSTGKIMGAGSVMHLLERHKEELRAAISSYGSLDEESAVTLVREADVRVWTGVYASCFMSLFPERAACHKSVGTPITMRDGPNFAVRSPEMCAGCQCSLILVEHKEFWTARLAENELVLAEANMAAEADVASIAQRRIRQSKGILVAFSKRTQDRTSPCSGGPF